MRLLALFVIAASGCWFSNDFDELHSPDRPAPSGHEDSRVLTLLAGALGGYGNADGTAFAARFSEAYGLASDGVGNLYVADKAGHTIRKIVLKTRLVSTLAGSPGMTGSVDGTGTAARFF